jgi:SAM-dependent methyltransferase
MDLDGLRANWQKMGTDDPLWSILTVPEKGRRGRWELEEFFATGEEEVCSLLAYLAQLGIDPPKRRALDFGCGVGRLTFPLAHRVEQVWGVDIAPSMIERAREYNTLGDRCRFAVNDADDLSVFDDATFDLVYTSRVLQHMPPRLITRYLRELIRVLSPDGAFVFQLPSEPTSNLRGLLVRLLPEAVLVIMRRVMHGYVAAMEMHGVKPEKVRLVVAQCNAVVADVASDHSAGESWVSFRYCVTKRAAAPL